MSHGALGRAVGALLLATAIAGCAHTLGYAGAHPGKFTCRGKGTVTGTGNLNLGAGVGGSTSDAFSLTADCPDQGLSIQQGPTTAEPAAKP